MNVMELMGPDLAKLIQLANANLTYITSLPTYSIYRQAFIGGNFDIWQRGTSFSLNGYFADRWSFDQVNATVSQQSSGVPVGSKFCARVTTTGTGYGALYHAIDIDTCKKYAGKTATVFLKMRRNAAFDSNVNVIISKNATGDTLSGGVWSTLNNALVLSGSLPTGTTSSDWLIVSFEVSIPNDGSANGLRFLVAPLTNQSAGAYYEVSQVKMNDGEVDLPFQPRSGTEELLLCRPFCNVLTDSSNGSFPIGIGYGVSATAALIQVTLPQEMRIPPTLVATPSDWQLLDGNVAVDVTALSIFSGHNSKNKLTLRADVASGLTQFRPYSLHADGTAGRKMIFDSEL